MKLWSDFVGRVFPTSLDLSFSHRVSSFHRPFRLFSTSTSRFHTECHPLLLPLVLRQSAILDISRVYILGVDLELYFVF